MSALEVKVTGIDDYRDVLASIPKKLRRRALLNSLKAGARVVRDAARRKAPVLSLGTKAPYRKAGTLRGAISVRTSKRDSRAGDVGVFVNVKPLPGNKYATRRATNILGQKTRTRVLVRRSARSATNPNDPFYWPFVNFGHKDRGGGDVPGFHFLEAGAAQLDEALRVIEKTLGPQVQRLEQNPKDPL